MPIQVFPDGNNIVLAWPTNAVGFRAQSRIDISISEKWSDLNISPSIAAPFQQIVLPRTNNHQFFRLFKEFGTNPIIDTLMVSTDTLTFGSTAILGFNIIEPDINLAALDMTWTNVLGSFSNIMSAKSIGLPGVVSRADLPIRADKLPIGTSVFKLRLVDSTGLYSEPVYFEITIAGKEERERLRNF